MKTVCITGVLPEGRSEFKNRLQQAGFKVVGSVSQDLDYLVNGEKAGSKTTKADDLGIRIVNYWEMCNIASIMSMCPPAMQMKIDQKLIEKETLVGKKVIAGDVVGMLITNKEDKHGVVVVLSDDNEYERVHCTLVKKYVEKKPVDLEWLVSSGVDCEFSNNISDPRTVVIDTVRRVNDIGQIARSATDHTYQMCRPRMNKWMVADCETLHSIPEGFDIEHREVYNTGEDECLYTFIIKGLKHGYCWPWEV